MAHNTTAIAVAVRSVQVPCPKADAVAVVQDFTALPAYEQKAREVHVEPNGDGSGEYDVIGKLAGLVPWRRTFRYVLHADGFHSVDAEPPADGWGVSGGFFVREAGPEACEVVHYERYTLPDRWRPMRRIIGAYMRFSQRRELKIIHDLVILRSAELRAARGD